MDDGGLLEEARAARDRARAPYSHFAVGAALLAGSGRIYLGCNVESATYGLTLCAERVALYSALSEGERSFAAMAVAVPDGRRTIACGICRQILVEFAPGIRLILLNADGTHRVETVAALLPNAVNATGWIGTAPEETPDGG